MEELVSLLATGVGSYELVDQDVLFSTHKSWGWGEGRKQKVSTYSNSEVAPEATHIPLQEQ